MNSKNNMARNVTDINKRDAEILMAALRLIKSNGGEMKHSAIKEELPKVFQFTENELSPRKTWKQSWMSCLGMVGGIELKAAGLLDIRKGVWSLTKEGEDALSLSPEDFYKLYHYRWLEIRATKAKANNESQPTATEEQSIEESRLGCRKSAKSASTIYYARKNTAVFVL